MKCLIVFSLLAVSCALAQSHNDGRYYPEQNQGKYDDGKYRPDNRGAYRPGDNGQYRGNGRVSSTRISTIGSSRPTQTYTAPARVVTRPQVVARPQIVARPQVAVSVAPSAPLESNLLGYFGIDELSNRFGDNGFLNENNFNIADFGSLGSDYGALLAGNSYGLGADLGGINGIQTAGIHLPTHQQIPLDLPLFL